jgi:signal transduction histidine kinase
VAELTGPRSATPAEPAQGSRRDEFEALLESVSHDLRSPLLTMALSAELLRDGGAAEREQLAYASLREGISDLERMLDAVTTLTRAARRTLAPRGALAGVVPRELLVQDVAIEADARLVAELLDALDAEAGGIAVRADGDTVDVAVALPEGSTAPDGSPLAALLDSLKAYAGGIVERLAAIELQAARQRGALTVEAGRAVLRLPRTPSR